VAISGAKNAALPELCAALLTTEPVTLTNVPRLQDVATTLKLLRNMGATAERSEARARQVTLDAGRSSAPEAPYELVKTMRASILVLGPLLARFGEATVSLPGGCAIGSRPVDQHIKGLQAMGAEITSSTATSWPRPTRLKGARITTDMVTVTGTENLLMAAALAEGETVLENAAQEPEVPDLAELLIAMGAKIEGHGTDRIRIQGVDRCTRRAPHRIMPGPHRDRHLPVRGGRGRRRRDAARAPRRPPRRRDRQAARGRRADRPMPARTGSACACDGRPEGGELPHQRVPGVPDRHAGAVHGRELHRRRHGAHHRDDLREPLHARQRAGAPGRAHRGRRPHGRRAPACRLSGATVMATDLRASASLVIAGLVAEGETLVDRIYHLDRGYDRMEAKLRAMGADIERVK
jgi:UDP-N-acetylglucosamine 1-carboxyvinyltransferase